MKQCTGKPQPGMHKWGATAVPKSQQPRARQEPDMDWAQPQLPWSYDGKSGIGRGNILPFPDSPCKPWGYVIPTPARPLWNMQKKL